MTLEEELRINKKGKKVFSVMKWISVTCVVLSCVSLVAIVVFILIKGLPNISLHFLFGKHSERDFAISGILITTLKLVFVAILISIPIGIGCAVFLNQYTKSNSRFVKVIRMSIQTLAGVPSIVFGLFGMLMFVDFFNLGVGIWAGGLTLALMLLPTIVTTVEESLKQVPKNLLEASYGLGAGKLRTTMKVLLPSAMPGVVSSIILSMGRVVSESASVLFTAGSSFKMSKSFGGEGASLAVAMYLLASEGFFEDAFAVAVVLIVLVVCLNLLAAFFAYKLSKEKK